MASASSSDSEPLAGIASIIPLPSSSPFSIPFAFFSSFELFESRFVLPIPWGILSVGFDSLVCWVPPNERDQTFLFVGFRSVKFNMKIEIK